MRSWAVSSPAASIGTCGRRRAITYGARSSFDMRAPPAAVSLRYQRAGRLRPRSSALARSCASAGRSRRGRCRWRRRTRRSARASLTRGYVRHFETAAHLVRALRRTRQLRSATPTLRSIRAGCEAVTAADLTRAAQAVAPPRRLHDRGRRRRPGRARHARSSDTPEPCRSACFEARRVLTPSCCPVMKAVRFHQHGGPERSGL